MGSSKAPRPSEWLVVIGSGTGGPQALAQLVPQFPPSFPGAILVLQHMRPGFTRVLANQLNQVSKLPVCEPLDGQLLQAGRVLVVPSGWSATIGQPDDRSESAKCILLENVKDQTQKLHDRTNQAMISAAGEFGSKTAGVLLTGNGPYGTQGMRAIAEAGGITIAQDEASCVVFDVPSAAISADVVSEVVPLWNVAERTIHYVMGDVNATAA